VLVYRDIREINSQYEHHDAWAYGKKKFRGPGGKKFARLFRIVPKVTEVVKIFRRNFPKLLSTGRGGGERSDYEKFLLAYFPQN
jgi:hypothetical protein